jgi:Amt family ammonium transporter
MRRSLSQHADVRDLSDDVRHHHPALLTGAVAERMKYASLVVFVTVWSIIVYYRWPTWSGAAASCSESAPSTSRAATSSTSVPASARWCWPDAGQAEELRPATYHPHNAPFVFLGAALLWFGWFGFNGGSALAANGLAAHAFLTTNTAAAAAMLTWLAIEIVKSGKPTLVGGSTGLVVGLVAITPGAGFVPVWAAILIGGAVSCICYYFISVVKPRFGYDDALDVFGCHGIGGIWGGIATGLFARKSINPAAAWDGLVFGDARLFLRQLAAILVTIALAVAGTLIAGWIASLAAKGLRVSKKDEDVGLDVSQHGEMAYPAFNGLD